MKHRLLAGWLGLLLAFCLPVSVLADAAIDSATNALRAEYGRAPLVTLGTLGSLAATRAQQISTNFAHPSDWQWMFNAIPGCEAAIGENIAYYTSGAEPFGWPVSAWAKSPTHFENILRDWTWQGSAVYRANGFTYAVQLFAKACSAPAPAPVPAPVPRTGPPIVDEIPDTHM